MKNIIRCILFIPTPKISAEKALDIARKEYEQRGGAGWDPSIIEGLKYWTVICKKSIKGAVRITIDQQSGMIIEYVQLPM